MNRAQKTAWAFAIPFLMPGLKARVGVTRLSAICMGAGFRHMLVYPFTILSHYGWTSQGDRS